MTSISSDLIRACRQARRTASHVESRLRRRTPLQHFPVMYVTAPDDKGKDHVFTGSANVSELMEHEWLGLARRVWWCADYEDVDGKQHKGEVTEYWMPGDPSPLPTRVHLKGMNAPEAVQIVLMMWTEDDVHWC